MKQHKVSFSWEYYLRNWDEQAGGVHKADLLWFHWVQMIQWILEKKIVQFLFLNNEKAIKQIACNIKHEKQAQQDGYVCYCGTCDFGSLMLLLYS